MRSAAFLPAVGIKTPRHYVADDEAKVADARFASGDPVVVKGIGWDLWHKSDVGALASDRKKHST